MKIQAINSQPKAVNFGQDEQAQKGKSRALPMLIGGGAAGAIAGVLHKKSVTADSIMNKDGDSFTVKLKNDSDEATKKVIEKIKTITTDKEFDETIKEFSKEVFGDKEGLKANEFFEKFTEGDAKTVAGMKQQLKETRSEMVIGQKNELDVLNQELTKLSDEAKKAEKLAEINELKSLHRQELAAMDKIDAVVKLVDDAGDGEVSKVSFEKVFNSLNTKIKKMEISELLKTVEDKLVKEISGKRVAIYAGIGAAALGLVGALMGPKKEQV